MMNEFWLAAVVASVIAGVITGVTLKLCGVSFLNLFNRFLDWFIVWNYRQEHKKMVKEMDGKT